MKCIKHDIDFIHIGHPLGELGCPVCYEHKLDKYKLSNNNEFFSFDNSGGERKHDQACYENGCVCGIIVNE
jgi:hypothetical protein